MKKEITEYEAAEETVSKIQCGSCDETWDNRGIRGKQGVNTVILDAYVERHRGMSYSDWRKKDFGYSAFGDSMIRISGEVVEDYCNSCWDGFFTQGPMAEIEQPEYYVEEDTREEYFCDFCGSEMGEEPEHEVVLNPRIEAEPRPSAYTLSPDRDNTVINRIDEPVGGSMGHDRLRSKCDDEFDCCATCANEMFSLGLFSNDSSRPGLTRQVGGCMTSMLGSIKDVLLLKGV